MVGSPFRATIRTVTDVAHLKFRHDTGDGQTCNRADVSASYSRSPLCSRRPQGSLSCFFDGRQSQDKDVRIDIAEKSFS
jgi:hypothetical protein